jgi:hypothetical protein
MESDDEGEDEDEDVEGRNTAIVKTSFYGTPHIIANSEVY